MTEETKTTRANPAVALHRKLFANSEIKQKTWPDVFANEVGEIAAALHAAYMDGERNARKR